MELKRGIDALQREAFIDQAAKSVKEIAMTVYGGGGEGKRMLRNALYGKWLGHPFHPVIVVVPAGAWAVSEVLDLVGAGSNDAGYDRAADVTAAVGMAGAVLAVASGVNDWRFTHGKISRLGLIHGMANLGAMGAMGLSLLMRLNGSRNAARVLATVGIGVTVAAAYVGGELVYGEKVGVSHVSADGLPKKFKAVMADSELEDGKLTKAMVNDAPIVLLRRGERIYALADSCSHMGGPLNEGELDGTCVVCPWHGSKFSMESGRVIDGPATFPQPILEARVREGQIEVRLSPDSM